MVGLGQVTAKTKNILKIAISIRKKGDDILYKNDLFSAAFFNLGVKLTSTFEHC